MALKSWVKEEIFIYGKREVKSLCVFVFIAFVGHRRQSAEFAHQLLVRGVKAPKVVGVAAHTTLVHLVLGTETPTTS